MNSGRGHFEHVDEATCSVCECPFNECCHIQTLSSCFNVSLAAHACRVIQWIAMQTAPLQLSLNKLSYLIVLDECWSLWGEPSQAVYVYM